MINVSSYWTLPPSRQGKIRAKVDKVEQELQRIVGHYMIWEETAETIDFSLFCSRCIPFGTLSGKPLTKEQYLDTKHEMYGETCCKCNKSLA